MLRKDQKHGSSVTGRAPNRQIGREALEKRLKQSNFLNAIGINKDTGQQGSVSTKAEFERRF